VTIRIPKALLVSVAILGLLGIGLGAGYLLGRDSRAQDSKDLRSLRATIAVRNADDAVVQANTITRLRNVCRVAVRFPNKVGTPFSAGECSLIPSIDKLVTPPTFEQYVNGLTFRICNDLYLAQGRSSAPDVDCTAGTRPLPSEARKP
jgi:hypothetical protein